jgi:NAD(P)-dependent dehydrogenase (short-subunit alcohol dehydrogenase family)
VTAIVTGAGGNPSLGRSYARLLAARGACVVVNDVGAAKAGRGSSDNATAVQVAQEIVDEGGHAVADTHSVADEAGGRAVVATALKAFGRVDIVVNNAGVCIYADVDEMSAKDVRLVIDVNLLGTIWMSMAAWPHMRESGYGRVVNVVSEAIYGSPLTAVYGAAKGGTLSYSRGIASAGADFGIKCNAIAPFAGTRMAVERFREDSEFLQAMMKVSPESVAPAVALLCHDECPVTGETIRVADGNLSRIFLSRAKGLAKPNFTPEFVRDNFDAIMEIETAKLVPMSTDNALATAVKPYDQ